MVRIFIAGNVSSCATTAPKSLVRIDGNMLSLWSETANHRFFEVPLKPDGSVDIETDWAGWPKGRARVRMPAGSGPRPFEVLALRDACTYRIDLR